MRQALVIATGNKGKFEEIKGYLSGEFEEFFSLADFDEGLHVVEDGSSYLENAWKKARKIGNRLMINTLADDSGLEVSALGNGPGLFSSRYGKDDRERVDRLLQELDGVPSEKRTAVFKAYLVYHIPVGGRACVFYGSLRGYIGFERQGKNGFGYDPIFMLPDSGRALAELSREEKNRISHRGRALEAFKKFLDAFK